MPDVLMLIHFVDESLFRVLSRTSLKDEFDDVRIETSAHIHQRIRHCVFYLLNHYNLFILFLSNQY